MKTEVAVLLGRFHGGGGHFRKLDGGGGGGGGGPFRKTLNSAQF